MLKLATKIVTALAAAATIGVFGAPLASAATSEPAANPGSTQRTDTSDEVSVAWSYTIQPSCAGWEGPIRQGANYWGDASEGGGTPVECQNSAITDCGFLAEPTEMLDADGRLIVVGCNYGQGQLIKLFPGAVNDPALLAAHEFGHNWHGHSFDGCASWASPEDVMATTMC